MKLIDADLRTASKNVFQLRNTHYRILQNLAKYGPMNATELGKKTSAPKYTYHPFTRWGVKSRLYGSNKYLGLIPNQFVSPIKINKKEIRYTLTLKGLCAILAKTDFERIFIVKKYREFLRRFTKDKNMLKWSMDFIKSEIKLILYYNYIKGLNLTKYKQLTPYWDEFKSYDEKVIQLYFQNTKFLDKYGYYNEIKKEYLKLFFILDYTTHPIEWGVKHDFVYDYPEFKDPLRKYVDRWFLFIEQIILLNKEWMEYDMIQPLVQTHNQDLWNKEQKVLKKDAEIIVKNTLNKPN